MKRFLLSLMLCMTTLCTFAASGTAYIVEASSLNVRQKPSTNAAIIGKVTQGQVIEVLNIQNGWAYIVYQKSFGYVSSQYIRKKSGAATKTSSAPTTKSTATKSSSPAKSTTNKGATAQRSFPYTEGDRARYGGWTEAGVTFGSGLVGVSYDLVNGCYIRDYIFVGAGIGFRGTFSVGGALLSVPIYAQARGVLRVSKNVAPFLDLGIGGYGGWATNWETSTAGGGFYMRVAPGIRFGKHFHISLGYERCGFNTGIFAIGADW